MCPRHGTQKDHGKSGGGHGTGGARHAGSQERVQETPCMKRSKPGNDVTECVFCKVNSGSCTIKVGKKGLKMIALLAGDRSWGLN